MTIAELDNQIAAVEKYLTARRAAMAPIAERITAQVKAFLPAWTENHVRELVTGPGATRAKEMGDEGLQSFRRQLKDIVSALPDEIDKAYAAEGVWPHSRDVEEWEFRDNRSPYQDYHRYKEILPHFLQSPAVSLLGPVAQLIMNASLVDRFNDLYKQLGNSDRFSFDVTVPWSNDVMAPVREYAQHHKELVKLTTELAGLRKLRQEREAAEAWDRADPR